MATTYKTPGVYINEITTLPASVAQVETAIPAFIGYTEIALDNDGSSLEDVPKRITSMVEFRQFFGGAAKPVGTVNTTYNKPKVVLDESKGFAVDSISVTNKYHLFDSLQAYFANGGGPCYIVSVGNFLFTRDNSTITSDIIEGVTKLEPEDEVTLIVSPDAAILGAANLGSIQVEVLKQCNKLQDRFGVFDLKETASSNDVGETAFRNAIGTQYLKYGAAYGPWLETSFSYNLQFDDLLIEEKVGGPDDTMLNTAAVNNIKDAVIDLGKIEDIEDSNYLSDFDTIVTPNQTNLETKFGYLKDLALSLRGLAELSVLNNSDIFAKVIEKVVVGGELETIVRTAKGYDEEYPPAALDVFEDSDFNGADVDPLPTGYVIGEFNYNLGSGISSENIYAGSDEEDYYNSALPFFRKLLIDALAILEEIKTEAERVISLLETSLVAVDPIYANIKRAIAAKGIIIPPSGAIVGVYAATDANRGVWKAPANVSLASVVRPTIKVDNQTQESLNVHSTGKSINIIRSFTGKGVLIWGARTLAGNDNEWRYVPVRRLFNTAEESIKKATEFVVFEPNDANTWLRTRTLIENYLTGLWRQGALAGARPSDAFFVNVGLGQTMTAQDILEGRMIVEIGMAAVRPAEFIVIRFSHKLQES